MLHWADGGASDVDNAALLCERHHQTVHRRRLWAEVRTTPDDHGRYVVWDLLDGGYDRHLTGLERERSAHDPPPLTPERLTELVAAIAGSDPPDRRWAELELQLELGEAVDPDESWWHDESWHDEPEHDERWVAEFQRTVETGS